MLITIEKGVPLVKAKARATKYPFRDMEVGDSFIVLLKDSRSTCLALLQNSVLRCASQTIGSGKITTRQLPDGSGLRVWRTA